jgi:hypothetical protein
MTINIVWKAAIYSLLLFIFIITTSVSAAEPYVQRCADDITFVSSLYSSILGRVPGEAEIKKKLALLEGYKNFPREKLICDFFDSTEYQDLKRDNRGFVLDLFHGTLGREPEVNELNNKIAALAERNDRSMMVWGMIGSQEYKKKMKKCP